MEREFETSGQCLDQHGKVFARSSAKAKSIRLKDPAAALTDTVLIASILCPIVHIEAVRAVDVRDGSRIHIGPASI